MSFKRIAGPWPGALPAKALVKTLDLTPYRTPTKSRKQRRERHAQVRLACAQAFFGAVLDKADFFVIHCGPREPRAAALFGQAKLGVGRLGHFLLPGRSAQYDEHLVIKINTPLLKRLKRLHQATARRLARAKAKRADTTR